MQRALLRSGAAGIAVFLSLLAHAQPPARDCYTGAYRLTDGSFVDIASRDDKTLRWRRLDGSTGVLHAGPPGTWTSTFGWTDRPDGKSATFSACPADEIRFAGMDGRRIGFEVTDTVFAGHDVQLAGRLVLPRGSGAVAIVVLVHGAEHDSARDSYALQRMLPAEGVGAFVYDKRGTGARAGSTARISACWRTMRWPPCARPAVSPARAPDASAIREAARADGSRHWQRSAPRWISWW